MIGSTEVPEFPNTYPNHEYFGDEAAQYHHTKFVQLTQVLATETFDVLYVYLRQNRSTSLGSARPIVYTATGERRAIGPWKTPAFTSADDAGFHWEVFLLDQPITVNPPDVRFGMAIRGSALMIARIEPRVWSPTMWANRELNPDDPRCPSDPFDASGVSGDYVTPGHGDVGGPFCIYAGTFTPSPPSAEFSHLPQSPIKGQTIQFYDMSTDPDNDIVLWSWDFGDGVGTSNERDPTYVYDAAGTYNVTLIVTDSGGRSDTIQKPLIIDEPQQGYGRIEVHAYLDAAEVVADAEIVGDGLGSTPFLSGLLPVPTGGSQTYTVNCTYQSATYPQETLTKTVTVNESEVTPVTFLFTTSPPPPEPCSLRTATQGTIFVNYLPVIRRFRDRCLTDELKRSYYSLSYYLVPLIEKLRRKVKW